MTKKTFRIGQIVPSSNTTMETEIPKFLTAFAQTREDIEFTFHAARMRMKHVNKEELHAMDLESQRCVAELSDAPLDVVGYACLVAIMAMGQGYHEVSETNLAAIAKREGTAFPVVTSAGALVTRLRQQGFKRVSMLMPYSDALAETVVSYVVDQGIDVVSYRNFSVTDNVEVGRIPPERLINALQDIETDAVDAVVLSACVQMPSYEALPIARAHLKVPVTSTAEATSQTMLQALQLL